MALGTLLPFWPALLFTYLEPLGCAVGWKTAFATPSDFIARQTTASSLSPPSDGALILTYSLGNVYLLLVGMAILCTAITRDARVTKGYLLMVALGDLGHIYASYKGMGAEVFWNFNEYNDMMWGNIGMSAFLHVNRLATLLGVFGRIKGMA